MTDCPTCHRAVDGLACLSCRPRAAKNPPIPPAAKAKIDAIVGKHRKRPDHEAELERSAIRDEAAA